MSNVLERPVFILGLHRSGTTFLYELLSSSESWNSVWAWHVIRFDEIVAGHVDTAESQRLLDAELISKGIVSRQVDSVHIGVQTPEEYGFILDNHGHGLKLNAKSKPYFTHVCEVVQSTFPQQRHLLLKNPWDFGNADAIKSLVPSARFVCIERDPVRIIDSQWRFLRRAILEPMPYVAMLSRRYERLLRNRLRMRVLQFMVRRVPQFFIKSFVARAGRELAAHRKSIQKVDSSDCVLVSYEDLCRDPTATLEEIFTRLEVDIPDQDWSEKISPSASSMDPVVAAREHYIRRKLRICNRLKIGA